MSEEKNVNLTSCCSKPCYHAQDSDINSTAGSSWVVCCHCGVMKYRYSNASELNEHGPFIHETNRRILHG